MPSVNQIELHPYFQQTELQRVNAEYGILTQAWSPIGGVLVYVPGSDESSGPLTDPVITELAAQYGKTPAQIVLRWHVQQGRSAIPKSVRPERIAENFDIFDFELASEEIAALDSLNTGVRIGPDPAAVTLETFGREIPEA